MQSESLPLHGTSWVLHSNHFTERGDSVNALAIFGALGGLGVDQVSIMFPGNHPWNSRVRISEAIDLGLSVRPYASTREFRTELQASKPTHFLNFTSGQLNGAPWSKRYPHRWRFGDYVVLSHVVFRHYEPHGDVYAYVSDWLREWAQSRIGERRRARRDRFLRPTLNPEAIIGSLPHIVSAAQGDGLGFRRRFGLPQSAFLLGRIGGVDQFNDRVAQRAVVQWLERSANNWFVAVNTKVFCAHPRAVFVPTLRRSEVHDFFSAVDAQINGRLMGESFGLAICEGLEHGVPTIAPHPCRNAEMDAHHVALLQPAGWLYCTEDDILRLLAEFQSSDCQTMAQDLSRGKFSEVAFQRRLLDLLSAVR